MFRQFKTLIRATQKVTHGKSNFISFTSKSPFTTSEPFGKRGEYMCKEKIEKLEIKNKSKIKDAVKVRCYFNGKFWVCPNPNDPKRSKSLRDQFNQGYYMYHTDFYLTNAAFNNKNNWNS